MIPATLPHQHIFSNSYHSRTYYGEIVLKNVAKNTFDREMAYRMWFRDLLWKAFPAPSDAQRAKEIRKGLVRKGLGCSERQAMNWLRLRNDPRLRFVMATLAIAGAEIVFRKMEGRE